MNMRPSQLNRNLSNCEVPRKKFFGASTGYEPVASAFADFFKYGGRQYLIVGDRLSGWVEVFGSPASTTLAGAAGLVRHLRSFFATFGVPEWETRPLKLLKQCLLSPGKNNFLSILSSVILIATNKIWLSQCARPLQLLYTDSSKNAVKDFETYRQLYEMNM